VDFYFEKFQLGQEIHSLWIIKHINMTKEKICVDLKVSLEINDIEIA
jgi:hypothetical protein